MLDGFITFVRENLLSIVAVVIFGALALLAYHIHVSTDRFAQTYRDYAVVANVSDIGAIVPGAANNPVRMQINDLLTQALADKMTDARRLDIAKQALALMPYSQKQIDAINPKVADTHAAAQKMSESVDFISSTFSKGLPDKILSLAKKREAAINDIATYSNRADFDTLRIFQHIVSINGALPSSYIQELNNEASDEDQNFSNRQNRYYDLQNIGDEIKQDFADFAKRFSIKNTGE
jgi:hypothetical protein